MTTKVLLDCDTGCDDTLAILYAALHPNIELVGIGAVWGNVTADIAARNSAHTVAILAKNHIPVANRAKDPMTNIARALALEPELPRLVRGITIMGGAALAPGNVTPAAEANIWCDPEA